MHRASCAFYHVFLNRHGPRERLRDSRSPDSQHLQQRLEVLPLGRCLSSPAQLHDSRLRGAPLACPGKAQIPAQRREFHCPAPTLTLARSRVSGATPDSATPRRPVNTDRGLQLHFRSATPRKAPPERTPSSPLPFHSVPAGSPSASAPRLERSSANPSHAAGTFARRKTRYAAVP